MRQHIVIIDDAAVTTIQAVIIKFIINIIIVNVVIFLLLLLVPQHCQFMHIIAAALCDMVQSLHFCKGTGHTPTYLLKETGCV